MKTKTILIALIALLAITVLIFQSCKKDDPKDTTQPTPPTALFIVLPTSGTTNTNFAFYASGSTDNEDPISNLQVRWDFDGNGSWDTGWDYIKTQNHQYSSEATYIAKLEVKDTDELTGQYTLSIEVMDAGPPPTGYFTDPRDSQEYAYIEIGSQTWMAENLNYETPNSWWYDNKSDNGDIYGRLYTWDTALTVCPNGWHLPNHHEWTILSDYLGGSNIAGGKMKEAGIEHWNSPNTGATNSSGFNALPGGYHHPNGDFWYLGETSFFHSDTVISSLSYFGSCSLYYEDTIVNIGYFDRKTVGISVRCVRD